MPSDDRCGDSSATSLAARRRLQLWKIMLLATDTADADSAGRFEPNGSERDTAGKARPGKPAPGKRLEERVKDLRKQVERLVKAPGAPLKSAPFHTASTLQSANPGTEVLILISTPYWYGVETHEGQHGWMMRDQLEQR